LILTAKTYLSPDIGQTRHFKKKSETEKQGETRIEKLLSIASKQKKMSNSRARKFLVLLLLLKFSDSDEVILKQIKKRKKTRKIFEERLIHGYYARFFKRMQSFETEFFLWFFKVDVEKLH
jgi:hypothetical protein